MMRRKECVAMLLAGGQGSRLGALTKRIAKPAVSFGGKYRIIDFSLSNCVNSGIDTVGVLTQYKPLVLNSYLGNGNAWNLNSYNGGLRVLPPYATESGGKWYAGTADAIYQNIDFIDSYVPEYVIILSGDHIYKMDYGKMLDFHRKKNADLTVSVIKVPMEEAKRFGIMTTDENERITHFDEKPREPKSNLASMGVYIFSKDILENALRADRENMNSDHDFGKNVIPMLLDEGKRLFAYNFYGYWKDVGTIESYYESQMMLLDGNSEFNAFDSGQKVFSNSNMLPPHYVGSKGQIADSIICDGCTIMGMVKRSVISPGVFVDKNTYIEDSILLPNSYVGDGTKMRRTIINEGIHIGAGQEIGRARGKITVLSEKMCAEEGR